MGRLHTSEGKGSESVKLVRYGGLAETGWPFFISLERAAAGAGVDAGEGRSAGGQPFRRGRVFAEGEGLPPDVVREVIL